MNREQCTIYRAALHAWKVRLRQPFNGRKIELEVPVPEDFKKYGGFYVSSGS
jgi:23S rRNA pseudouridine1911/1915/1917 synthase